MTKPDGSKNIHGLHLKAEVALKRAVVKAIARHESAGVPPVVWKNGRVVHLPVAQPRPRRRGK